MVWTVVDLHITAAIMYNNNVKKPKVLEVLSIKIQCDVRWYSRIFRCLSFLRQGKIFWSSKECLICLFWDFSTAYWRGQSSSLMTIVYSTLLIHWIIVAMWVVFHCTSENSDLIFENRVLLRNIRLKCEHIRGDSLVDRTKH